MSQSNFSGGKPNYSYFKEKKWEGERTKGEKE